MKLTFLNGITDRIRNTYATRHSPEGARMLAIIYWRALLLAAFLVLVATIGYAELQLYGILKDLASVPESTIPAATLDRAALGETVAAFEARQSEYESLKQGASGRLPDPSR
ncbi:MAG: hypothetical protein U1D26_01190 [Patescibacteria group bacterium]|nr:hypothetical protein [bacterium]MDZ4227072.1 hypothetical protein [Patescibacteria group bacterium]